jgi:PadR family transcriptional regulator, regulatory protein PadR
MARQRAPSKQTRTVLAALMTQPLEWRHGYDLAKLVGLGSGTLYPLLIRLHERGLLEARWDEPGRPGLPPRHAYRLSAQGVAYARQIEMLPGEGSPEGAESPA